MSSAVGTQNSESSRLIDGILGRKGKPKENGSVVTETPRSKPDSASQPPKTETTATTTTAASAPPSSQPPSESTTAPKPTATKAPAVTTTTAAITPAVVEPPAEKQDERGRGKEFQSNSNRKVERSVSPGTLPDGRHAKTDGDRGLSYVPPNKLGKLGAKLGMR